MQNYVVYSIPKYRKNFTQDYGWHKMYKNKVLFITKVVFIKFNNIYISQSNPSLYFVTITFQTYSTLYNHVMKMFCVWVSFAFYIKKTTKYAFLPWNFWQFTSIMLRVCEKIIGNLSPYSRKESHINFTFFKITFFFRNKTVTEDVKF